MEPEARFFFFLAAAICFAVATLGEGWRFGGRTRRGVKAAVTLEPLGLLLFVIPFLWDAADAAW